MMMAMPGPSEKEEPRDRAGRLATIAIAIVEETRDDIGWFPSWQHYHRASLVAVKTYHESGRWRLDVHNGKRRGDQGRSVCLGQIMSGHWIDVDLHRSLPGTDMASTRRCIKVTTAYLSRARRMCSSGLNPSMNAAARAYALYGTGYRCEPLPSSLMRARHFVQFWHTLKGKADKTEAARQSAWRPSEHTGLAFFQRPQHMFDVSGSQFRWPESTLPSHNIRGWQVMGVQGERVPQFM
jgi:hypothetical protein